jgi:hypothetical protein
VLGNNDISPPFESSYLEEIQRISNLVLLLLLLLLQEIKSSTQQEERRPVRNQDDSTLHSGI